MSRDTQDMDIQTNYNVYNQLYMIKLFYYRYYLLLQAILKFVTSYKDLEESLRPEIEQLRREVKEIQGTACII